MSDAYMEQLLDQWGKFYNEYHQQRTILERILAVVESAEAGANGIGHPLLVAIRQAIADFREDGSTASKAELGRRAGVGNSQFYRLIGPTSSHPQVRDAWEEYEKILNEERWRRD